MTDLKAPLDANQLIATTRRIEALTARENELRGMLERQRAKLAETVQAVDRYFADIGKVMKKMEKAKTDADRIQAYQEFCIATEYARQGLPNVN